MLIKRAVRGKYRANARSPFLLSLPLRPEARRETRVQAQLGP